METKETEGLVALEQTLGYVFKNRALLVTALTHTSFVKGDGAHTAHNERMEFLGDAVLELCVSEYLYKKHSDMDEGLMTRTRARLVCEEALFAAAKQLGLPAYIRLGHGMERTGGREKPSIVSDAMEAVIGAVFLDGGIADAKELIISRIVKELEKASVDILDHDYKTRLQEWVQHRHAGTLVYTLESESGPEHKKNFVLSVSLNGEKIGEGDGQSKQAAGQMAAENALKRLLAATEEQE